MLAVEFQHPLLLTSMHQRFTPMGAGSTSAEDITKPASCNSKNLLEHSTTNAPTSPLVPSVKPVIPVGLTGVVVVSAPDRRYISASH
jgi:hypothetical protein